MFYSLQYRFYSTIIEAIYHIKCIPKNLYITHVFILIYKKKKLNNGWKMAISTGTMHHQLQIDLLNE